MLLECVVTPDSDTEKKLFSKPWTLINFRAAARKATETLERSIKDDAPRATGAFMASIHSTIQETGDPFRMIGRVYSTHPAADAIEFGAAPHVVPVREILRWMRAIDIKITGKTNPLSVAFAIQARIADQGLKPHHVFSQAYEDADAIFHAAIDPIMDAMDGSAEYTFELRSAGSHAANYEPYFSE